jgi:hypothetical protein
MTKEIQAYEAKNKQDYDDNTDKIYAALDKIKTNKRYKATISQLVELTGIHRNTLRDREFPKERLEEISRERKVREKLDEEPKKNALKELETQLDNAKTELILWFSQHQTMEADLSQMEMKYLREKEALDFYKRELEKERNNNKIKQTEIARLTDLLRDI